jgi:hypothetical protein
MVDAVAKAYNDEVVNGRRQRRYASRDLLARNLEKMNAEIKRKLEDYLDIGRELGSAESGSGRMLLELDLKRLDRVEDELARLENEAFSSSDGDAAKSKAREQRMNQLRERQAELEKKITSRAERSSGLELRQRRLEQLQRIASEMSDKLQQLDIEASSPDRIRQVQAAVPSPQ